MPKTKGTAEETVRADFVVGDAVVEVTECQLLVLRFNFGFKFTSEVKINL